MSSCRSAILLTIAALAGAPVATRAQQPSLTGPWTFNRAASDNTSDYRAKCDQSVRSGSQQDLPHGPLQSSGLGLGKPIVLTETQRDRMDQTLEIALDVALTITLTPTTATFATETGDTIVLNTDGRKAKQTSEGSGDVESRSYWQGNELLVERKVDGGGKVTVDAFRAPNGTQLYVVVTFEGKCGQFQFRRVYDPPASH